MGKASTEATTVLKERVSKAAQRRRAVGFAVAVIRRYWSGDGPSHTRGLAYHTILVLLSGLIGLLGLASLLGSESVRGTVTEMVTTLSPGPSGRILREAAARGTHGGGTVVALGFLAALAAGTRGMRQLELAANRMFGVEKDRPFIRRWSVALGLALSAGSLIALGALAVAGGRAIARGVGFDGGAATMWTVLRWPLGVAAVGAALLLIYRVAPRRRPGTPRDLMMGVLTAVVLWALFTGLLVLYFLVSGKDTQTYGPLVGIVALLLWSAFTSLAAVLGLAVIAELAGVGRGSSRRSA